MALPPPPPGYVPPPPPPPPPTPYPIPGPAWGAAPPPGAWPSYGGPPRPSETTALRSVRNGISLYRWAVLLNVVTVCATAALSIVSPSVGRYTTLPSLGPVSPVTGAGVLTGAGLALVGVAAVLGLVGLVLSIVAFVRWREGVLELRRTRPIPGMHGPGGAPEPAGEAETGYRRSVWTMLGILLIIIAGIAVIAISVVGSLTPHLNPNGTLSSPSPSQVSAAVASAVYAGIGLGVAIFVAELALAYFVTGSLHGFLGLGPTGPRTVDVATARLLVYASVAVSLAGLLNFVFAGLGLVAAAGPILLFLACHRYLRAFDERLTNPAAPSFSVKS